MMRHPADGTLRRLLDEPVAVSDPDRRHTAGCPRCTAQLGAMRRDADLVAEALTPRASPAALDAVDAVDADVVAGAWQRLSTAAAAPAPRPVLATVGGRGRAILRRPAIAALAVAVVVGGAGAAAANDWLQIFRTEQVAPLVLDPAELVALPDLSSYGDVTVDGATGLEEVPDAATAAARSGLEVPVVDTLPRGVTGTPAHRVGGQVGVTFTFSAERAAATARAATGKPAPAAPPGLDGSRVRLVAGPAVASVWSRAEGPPALVVVRAVAPTAYSTGVPFEVVRDHLLSLPGLPPEVAARLRTFRADGSTLPLPVPAGRVSASTSDVDGAPATVLTTRDRTLAAVVWVRAGVVTAVAGSLDADEVLTVARGLR